MKTFKKFINIKEAHDLFYLSEGKLSNGDLRKTLGKTSKLRVNVFADQFFSGKKFKKTDGNEVTIKTIEFNGYEYSANGDKEEFLKDFSAAKKASIQIVEPEIKIGDLEKTSEFGGASGKGDSKIYKDFKISSNTEFIEFFQALGFCLSSLLPDTEDGFVNTLQSVKIKGDFKHISNDWKAFCRALYKEELIRNSVLELVNGSFSFMQEAKIKNPHVVWLEIKSYYSAMTSFEKGVEFTKDNTADIVIIEGNKTISDIKSALKVKGQTLTIDKKYGKLTTVKEPVVSWYQVSLKLGESAGRLGRVTGIFKNKYLYLEPGDDELSNVDYAANKQKTDESLEEYNQSLNEFVELYNEGWFDNIKTITSKVVDKVKAGVKQLTQLVTGAFKYFFKKQKISNWKKEQKDVYKEIDAILKNNKVETSEEFEKRTGKNFIGRVAKYKRSLGESNEFLFEGAKQELQIDGIMNNAKALKEFTKLVKSRLDKVEATANSKDGTFHYIKRLGGGKGTTHANIKRDTIKMNMAN